MQLSETTQTTAGRSPVVTPLPTPAELEQAHPLSEQAKQKIAETRQQVIDILEGKDVRMIAIVGPCSEDDSVRPDGTPSVVHYARELRDIAQDENIRKKVLIVMRCPPAKPRSDLGLAGLEQKDVAMAHKLLTDIANLGVPLAVEVMGSEHIARYGNLVSLHWVGARNNKDTILRHSLSAYPEMPVLIKNDEHGELQPALQAVQTIKEGHDNARITLPDGRTGYVRRTDGNPHAGIVRRGGTQHMSPEGFETGLAQTVETGLPYAVDCAHANEQAHDSQNQKTVAGQKACFNHLLDMLQNSKLQTEPKAIMIESYLLEGNDTTQKTPGKSWTDPCISLEDTKEMIKQLASVAS